MVGKKYWYVMYCITYQYFTLDTNFLPPPGIEPGSPALQVGTLPKKLWRQHLPVLRIQNVYPESRIPDPGSDFFPSQIPDPTCLRSGSRIRIKEFKYFNPKKNKKWFLSSRKYDPSCSSQIPDPDADFLPIPDPESRGQKGTGSRIPANHPPPPEYLLTQDSCKESSPPLLHTTIHNNTTQQHSGT